MGAKAVCTCGWVGGPYSTAARATAMGAKHVCVKVAGVRRATRHHRCSRCGLEATYENAGATEARYWFSKHSCQRREQLLLRASQAELREALIDRTPKPCHHKQADHQHGTRACYVLDRCRCKPCAKANSDAETRLTRLKAYGRYNKYVPAEFVRDHLVELKEYGIGLKTVAKLSGVGGGTLTKIWYGTYAETGRGHERHHGEGKLVRGPSRRVERRTAEAIYAVEAIPANLGPRMPDHERTAMARLHIRALVAIGWSMSGLGERLGMAHPRNLHRMILDDTPLARESVDRIEALFTELAMTPAPETNQRERISASRARNYAKAHGWLPPLALDDLDADESAADHFDEAAIYRRMQGDRAVRLTKAEAAEIVRRWQASGRPLNECERLTGINPRRHLREEAEAS